jgi:hypothetical protein
VDQVQADQAATLFILFHFDTPWSTAVLALQENTINTYMARFIAVRLKQLFTAPVSTPYTIYGGQMGGGAWLDCLGVFL